VPSSQPGIVAPITTALSPPDVGGTLPTTGGEVGRTLLIALITVVLGAGMVIAIRRRHV
jgi:LPXTG-motif cell wall-anchored protein